MKIQVSQTELPVYRFPAPIAVILWVLHNLLLFVYTSKQVREERKEWQSDPWLQWFPVPCQGQKGNGPSEMEGKRYIASQNCSWKWHFHAQGHEWTCRTTPFPSATCPWASVSSYRQPLYLSSLSVNMSDRTQHFLPHIRTAPGDAQNYWFQLLFRTLQPTRSFTHFTGWQDHKRTKRKMGFHIIVEGMGNAMFEKQNYSPRLF